ncbi:MAG: alpha/beta fold hydrolase [Nitrospirae bacterium]|nr:MAG: alpha/beta fold hydrolase [Nitrospirota bacterium]
MWEPQVRSLSGQFRVVTVDLRGHGESDAPLWLYSMDQFADDVKGLLDHLSIQQAVLAGFSMGGYVVFAFYRKYAARVNGLVLADTRPQPDSAEGRAGRFKTAQTAHRDGAGAIADIMLPKLLSPASVQGKPDLVQKVRAMMSGAPVTGIAGDLMAMAERPDSVPLLKEITCPTLVIVGELDGLTPPADAKLMADTIKGARIQTIPAAAHLSNLEQPETFTSAVKSFLETIRS